MLTSENNKNLSIERKNYPGSKYFFEKLNYISLLLWSTAILSLLNVIYLLLFRYAL